MNSLDSLEGVHQELFERNEDGSMKQFMPKVNGKGFRCDCGCNVFHRPWDEPNTFICNSCDATYQSE